MFLFTWWNIKRARSPAIISTGALNQALLAGVLTLIETNTYLLSASLDLDGGNLNENVPVLFKFKKPLNSRREENTLVTLGDSPTSFGSPKFPVPYVVGGSTLDTFPVYAPTKSNTLHAYVDTTMMKKRYHFVFAVHPPPIELQHSVAHGLAILLDALTSLLALLAAGFACAMFFTLWRDIDGESRKHTTGMPLHIRVSF